MNKIGESPLERARALAPAIKAGANQTDADRQIPRGVADAMADAGLFKLLMSRSFGGSDLDLPTYVEVMEELGKADASTAWVMNQTGVFGAYASMRLPVDVARLIWVDTPRSLAANSPAATVDAEVVPGGFRATGEQGFSTGCRHATWVGVHVRVLENGAPRILDTGLPETRFLFVPIDQIEIVDTWTVRGMRGTGTNHIKVTNVFVPEDRSFRSLCPALREEGPYSNFPFSLVFAGGDAAIAVGVARACLDVFLELAQTKAAMGIPGLLRDQQYNQVAVGQAEGNVRAARAFLMESARNVWKEMKTTGAVGMDQRADTFLAQNHAVRLAADAVDSVYNMAGTTGMYDNHPIQRAFQDMHVITQHVQLRMQNYEKIGRYYLGLDVGPLVY